MRVFCRIISLVALLATIAPSVAFLAGTMTLDQVQWIMLVAMLVWFAVTPLWMDRTKSEAS